MEHIPCDVLVLGSGGAGLRAAISAREAGLDVCVLSKGGPGKSTCTGFSAGVMGGARFAGCVDDHRERTLKAGRGINQRDLVDILTEESHPRLQELVDWGARAEFRNGFLFAAGRPPVLGEEIVRCLIKRNRELGTRIMGRLFAADMVIEHGTAGVVGFEQKSRRWLAFTAGAVVLATGGAAALYLRHDNPGGMLGDGCRLALDAGAVIQDMEFVQFYPVCLAEPGHAPLVVPPRLADCGLLVNDRGDDILKKYDIDERPAAEKARDRLSQALFREIHREGRRVFLDLRGLTEEKWNIDPFSASMRQIFEKRYRALDRPLRVAPAAHHTMGGIKIDATGATTVGGLFAAGEVAGGLHGANRLGGNALSETLVFGARAGNAAANLVKTAGCGDRQSLLSLLSERLSNPAARPTDGADYSGHMKRLRTVMWEGAGILRNRAGLEGALEVVGEILENTGPLCGTLALSPATLKVETSGSRTENPCGAIELHSAARIASIIIEGALRRLESRGAHYREDFPNPNDKDWLGRLQVRTALDGKHEWRFEQV